MFRKAQKTFECGIFLLLVCACLPASSVAHNYKPAEGYVATAEVAIKIAEAVLTPIYGRERIEFEKPFVANLTDDKVWIVKGTLRPAPDGRKALGGVAEIRIDKDSGKILNVTHGE